MGPGCRAHNAAEAAVGQDRFLGGKIIYSRAEGWAQPFLSNQLPKNTSRGRQGQAPSHSSTAQTLPRAAAMATHTLHNQSLSKNRTISKLWDSNKRSQFCCNKNCSKIKICWACHSCIQMVPISHGFFYMD